MKERALKVFRPIISFVLAIFGMATFPVWIIVYIVNGFDYIDWLWRFSNPTLAELMDDFNELNKDIQELIRSITLKNKQDVRSTKIED